MDTYIVTLRALSIMYQVTMMWMDWGGIIQRRVSSELRAIPGTVRMVAVQVRKSLFNESSIYTVYIQVKVVSRPLNLSKEIRKHTI